MSDEQTNPELHASDSVADLCRAADQLLRSEQMLSGAVLAAGADNLPELEIAQPAAPAAGRAAGGYSPQAGRSGASRSYTTAVAAPAAAASFASDTIFTNDGAEMSPSEKASELAALAAVTEKCTNCQLHASGRKQIVFGDGDCDADLLFVGEGPGAEEDAQGLPFVGRSGELLTKMIKAMGLDRGEGSNVYIANVVKCRPPANRTPAPDEAHACWGYLKRQIEIIQPKVIVVLGNAAAKMLLETKIGITKLRGNWQDIGGIPVMPTFHPAYLLRQYTTANRQKVWSDLQAVMEKLGLPTK